MFQYVAIALLAIVGVLVVVNLVKGLLRGIKKTVGTLVAIVLSAIIAFIVTIIVCKPTSELVLKGFEMIKSALPEGEIQELLSIEALGEAFSYYAVMIVAPFFFTAAFGVISIVVSIVVAILVKVIPPFKKPGMLLNRLGGAGVGLVCGLIVALIMVMPIVGTIDLVASADEISLVEGEGMEDVAEILGDAKEDKVVNILLSLGCRPIYNGLASAKFDGERIYLKDDIGTLLVIADNVDAFTVEMSEYGDEQIEAIDTVVENLDSSAMLKNALSGVLSTAAGKWCAGEEFMGIEKPSAGELLDPIVDNMLETLSHSTKETIGEDLRTLAGVFSIMIESEMLGGDGDLTAMLDNLSKNKSISQLIVLVSENERMAPLADEVTKLSVKALASAIGIPENPQKRYDMLMSSVADAMNDTYGLAEGERIDALKGQLSASFVRYGVSVSESAVDNITVSIVHDLGALDNVGAEDVEEFFTIYSIATESVLSRNVKGYNMLAGGDKKGDVTINEDGTITAKGKVMKNYNAKNYKESKAYDMGSAGADFGNASTLYSADTMESTLVTAEELCSSLGSYSDCEDIAAEAARIEQIITTATAMIENAGSSNSPADLMPIVGEVLDLMSESEVFGSETSANLLTAVMQSEIVVDSLGMSVDEVTNFADKINGSVIEGGSDYKQATEVISGTIDMITSVTDNEKTDEEKQAASAELMGNMTSETAEMMASLFTPSLLKSYGVPDQLIGTVSSTFKSLINNMAAFDVASADDAVVAREAQAVNTILYLAMGVSTDAKTVFSGSHGAGALGMSADYLVDVVLSSEVISKTVKEIVYEHGFSDNPLGLPSLNAEDTENLVDALESAYAAGEDASTLGAIAKIFSVDVSF